MTVLTTCPDPVRLSELLEDRLPAEENARLAAHVDTCERCQKALDDLTAAGLPWSAPVTQPEPALQRALEELSAMGNTLELPAETADTEELSLDFLEPPADPQHLGRLGQYEVLEVIGRGGMGVVLKAFDPCLQRIVAVKVLAPQLATSPTARKRFLDEARAAAAVTHDHIVTIHAVDEANGLPYLVMQYIAGRSLQQRLEEAGSLELKDILRIGRQTAAGLAAAHAHGLIHRDIKPANILLEEGVQRVKITDF